jgi:chitobiase/beta-hexosaminidase-like protein
MVTPLRPIDILLLRRQLRGTKIVSCGFRFWRLAAVVLVFLHAWASNAQTNIVTQHYDNARTGANTNETILTPSNVNSNTFGLLFSNVVDGLVYAQPLYVSNVNIPGKGVRNVVYVATEHDSVYAFDADNNVGANATPLWQISLLDSAHGAAAGATTIPPINADDIQPEVGITGTPVIDPTSGTFYVVGATAESGTYIQRLHALDITTGAEKTSFNSPVQLQASVSGNGNGSSGGILNFDAYWENQRSGLLLQNGILYIAFGAHNDVGPWHGWILAYNATTLQPTGSFCATPNGSGAGIWMSGAGLAADVIDPVNQPYGRMFVATGNGAFNAAPPYTPGMSYADDLIRLDLTNGGLAPVDSFTPFNQAALNSDDRDTASGGVLLLPDQNVGGHMHLLVQSGKEGRIFLVDRDNMGGYSSTGDAIVQEIPTAPSTSGYQINGIWGMPAYWNGNLYFWGSYGDLLKAFSLSNGLISSTWTSRSPQILSQSFPGPTPVVSANGNSNGIVWTIDASAWSIPGPAVLLANDALNLSTLLYSSSQNLTRDNPGTGVRFSVPTVVNGKVYVGAVNQIDVYGLLNGSQTTAAARPTFSPGGGTYSTAQTVTISDATAGAAIYYTTNGTTPTTSSTVYTGGITVSSSETINAMAVASGYGNSAVGNAAYTIQSQVPAAATPTFSPAGGTYSTAQTVTISDATGGATIYYTTNGTTPTTSSTVYTGAITVSSSETINAMAVASGYANSAVGSATYTIQAAQQTPAATPTFSPAAGSYSTAQTVTMSDATGGATIYYTTNGTTPTTSSTVYTGAITVSSSETINAMAVASGYANSAVGSATYTIQSSISLVCPATSLPGGVSNTGGILHVGTCDTNPQGNALVLLVGTIRPSTAGMVSVTDDHNPNSAWIGPVACGSSTDVNGGNNYLYYVSSSVAASNGIVITVTPTAGNTSTAAALLEVKGLDASHLIDQCATNNNQAANAIISSPSITTQYANELLVDWGSCQANSRSMAAGYTNWTFLQSQYGMTGMGSCQAAVQIVSAPGAYQTQFQQLSPGTYSNSFVSFKGLN